MGILRMSDPLPVRHHPVASRTRSDLDVTERAVLAAALIRFESDSNAILFSNLAAHIKFFANDSASHFFGIVDMRGDDSVPCTKTVCIGVGQTVDAALSI